MAFIDTGRASLFTIGQLSSVVANAARVGELGLGVHVPLAEATPESLRAALRHVTSDVDIRRKLDAMRTEISSAGGLRTAVEVCESELRVR